MVKHLRLEQCDSTQLELKRQLEDSRHTETCLVSTALQTAGKGRGSNVWETHAGSLAFSFNAPVHPGMTWQALEISVSIALSVKRIFGIDLQLKWPNDLYFQDKKSGGILLQHQAPFMLIGIGLNMISAPDYGSHIIQEEPLISEWIHEIPKLLVEDYLKHHPIPQDVIREEWTKRCVHAQRIVTITEGDQVIEGPFQGIGQHGEALVGNHRVYNGTLRWKN